MNKVKFRSTFPGEDLLNPKFYQSGFLFTKSLLDALSSAIKTYLNIRDSVCMGGGGKNYRYRLWFKTILSAI